MPDSHYVHDLGLAHLDLVRLQHDDDGVPGVARHLAPTTENLRAGTLVGSIGT